MARRTSPERVYQLDIRLAHIDPPIWRRILVSDQITLAALHLCWLLGPSVRAVLQKLREEHDRHEARLHAQLRLPLPTGWR